MADIDALEDLFEHELAATYYVETELIDVIDEMALETRDDDIAGAFADHRDETREHARRLEDVFDALGEEPRKERAATLDGLVEDREKIVDAADDPDLIDTYSLGAGIKVERIEITSYESLLRMADELGYDEAVTDPLEQNLEEERDARQELSGFAEGSTLEKLLGKIT